MRLRLKAYVLDTQFEKAFETDVNLRVLRAFRQQGIAPPAMLYRDGPMAQESARRKQRQEDARAASQASSHLME